MGWHEAFYRLLLRAYPKRFQERYREEMLSWFRDHLEATRDSTSRFAGLRFWLSMTSDLIRSLPAQYLESLGWRASRGTSQNNGGNRNSGNRKGSEPVMETLISDLRMALRSFSRTPMLFALIVITLGVAVGFVTTMFSLVDGVLLGPLPYPEPERIVQIGGLSESSDRIYALSAPEAIHLQERNRAFEALAISRSIRTVVRGDGEPELYSGAMVSANFFTVMGTQPLLGRPFTQAEEKPGAPPVAILDHELWQRRWGGDPAIVGQEVRLGRTLFTVVGIMPPGFHPPEAIDQHDAKIWLSFSHLDEQARNDRVNHFLEAIGRLRPGISQTVAQAELTALGDQFIERFPDVDDPRFGLAPLHRQTVGGIGETLLPLFGAVGLLLLVACTNVANLLLIRGSERAREMALRVALGARRGRIVRQLLTESLLLGLLGGSLGVAVAFAGAHLFLTQAPVNIPRLSEVSIDGTVLAFAFATSVLTGLIFGLAPALRSSHPELATSLKQNSRGLGSSTHQERARNTLVVAQTAIAFVLVVGAGLLINSFVRLQNVALGFEPQNVHVLGIAYPGAESPTRISAFYQELLDRLGALPGVTSVGATANLPLSGNYAMRGITDLAGRQMPTQGENFDEAYSAYYQHVTPGFFETMQIPRLRGRDFNASDGPNSPAVAIINETMARDLFGDDDPLGQRFKAFDGYRETWYEVVGLVANARQHRLAKPADAELYLSFHQAPHGRMMDFVVRTEGAVAGMLPAMRAELREMSSDLPIRRSVAMPDFVASSIASPRFYTLLLAGFAAAALLLALVGIHGTLSYAIAQRSHEIGVRRAFGATDHSVLGMILGRGMKLVLVGVLLGLVGASFATRALESFVFGITPTDTATLSLGVVAVVIATIIASLVSARRAIKLDPIEILKGE